ncbi:DOPA 4,5-dioxygenase family protein [Rhodopila sp.]|uniref:DOPA 4,5-dioxygenase family protein n=1 Tax=Rhodopila sp. TaxID=2480087 RepID=UPI002B58FFE9|nr:DOPA 4,5-dioxygenase family protein [Rhodopila sp.]HVZ07421.1 DOPA 4,5-dioxygenase family protein [Rhodopila sp.]
MTTPTDPARISDYHMHVYYDPATRETAALLREWIQARFPVRMGRWHDNPVGPHPTSMYQIAFAPDMFPTLVPFVMLNRMGLTVLLHPESGRPRDDHTLHATWMGAVLPLKTEILRETSDGAA